MKGGSYTTVMVGPAPPPLGGIAVYLDRLRKVHPEYQFVKENGLSKWGWLRQCFKKNRMLIYHSPNINRIIALYWIKLLTGNKYSLFSHGSSLRDACLQRRFPVRYLLKKAVTHAECVYVLNSQIYTFMKTLGVEAERVQLASSFLPPPAEEESAIWNSYSQATLDFIQEHSPLLIVNASALVFYQGVDLYGLDMCVGLMAELIKSFPKAGLIVALAEIGDLAYYQSLQEDIANRGLINTVYMLTGNKKIWPLFKKVHVLVRPTMSDGDAVSLREAISFGCQTVASDVCDRPRETTLFKARDSAVFLQAVLSVLSQGKQQGSV